jgi:SAM-dependent methyltransferase
MEFKEALQLVAERFPFDGYINSANGSYANIATTVSLYLKPGSKILDFGCGPCDQTAVLQYLGYECTAYDDLQDDWHKKPGNIEKILAFANECGIDFRVACDSALPFQKNWFDMVMLHSVLEHLHDSPRELLNNLLELVKPTGFLFITVPNAVNIRKRLGVLMGRTNLPPFEGYYWYPSPWRGHVREYVGDDLRKLSKYQNLEVVELRGCDHMLEKLPAAARPIYLLLTRVFTAWKDSWLLVARKPPDWQAKWALTQDDLAQILQKSTPYKYAD